MKKSRLLGAVYACLASLSFNASATLIPADIVSIVDHGDFVTDTVTGWDWLDLTETAGLSYTDVISEMGTGGLFEGWSYATRDQLGTLWTAYGGDANYYSGWSTQNDGLFDLVAADMGDLYCIVNSCLDGEGFSHWITADIATQADLDPTKPITVGDRLLASLFDRVRAPNDEALTQDYANLQQLTIPDYDLDPTPPDLTKSLEYGSALYRVSAVPVPAAVWLFGSGLLGLVGLARRKKA